MKTTRLLTIIFISILFLCGCSKKKTSIDATQFLEMCDELNIGYEDVIDTYAFANEALLIKGDNYLVLYIEGENINDVSGMFYDDIKNVFSNALNDEDDKLKKDVKEGKNWKSLEVTLNGKYYYLTYIDNTYLYMQGKEDNLDIIKKIRKKINY